MKRLFVSLLVVHVMTAFAASYTVPANTSETVTSANVSTYNAYDEGITVPSSAGLDFADGAMSFTAPVTVASGGSSVFSNGADVVVGDQVLTVQGSLLVTNATLRMSAISDVRTGNGSKALVVKGGTLTVDDGAVVTNRLYIGNGYNWGKVLQRGGSVVQVGSNGDTTEHSKHACLSARGFYELCDGSLEIVGSTIFSTSYQGPAAFAMHGGRLSQRALNDEYAYVHTTAGQCGFGFTQFGGTTDMTGSKCGGFLLNRWSGSNVFGILGSNTFFKASVSAGYHKTPWSPAVLSFADGATFSGNANLRHDDNYYGNAVLIVNFNNARFQPSGDYGYFCGPDKPNAQKIVIHDGGLVFDSVKAGTVLACGVLRATGKGVAKVNWNKNATYEQPPVIVIKETGTDGKGWGASAVPVYDRVTKKVTDVIVVSPGCDYTEATAYFEFSDVDRTTFTTELAENKGTGSFTLTGSNSIYSDHEQFWGGPTVLKGASFYQRADYGIPRNAELKLEGGAFRANGYKFALKSIGGTAGIFGNAWDTYMTGRVDVVCLDLDTANTLNLSRVTLSVTGRWDVAAADFAADKCADYNSTIAFDPTATIDVSALGDFAESGGKHMLAKANLMTGKPTLVGTGADKWRVFVRNNALLLSPKKGHAIFLK